MESESERQFVPPSHLSDAGKAFWRSTQAEYGIQDDVGLKVLTLASEALDTAEVARLEVVASGAFFTDRLGNRRPNPGLAAQRNAMIVFGRLIRQLGVDPPEGK